MEVIKVKFDKIKETLKSFLIMFKIVDRRRNPIDLPEKVFNEILSYLNIEDIMTLTLVDKKFHQYITNSKVFFNLQHAQFMIVNGTKYKHMELSNCLMNTPQKLSITKLCSSYVQNFELNDCKFQKPIDFINFIRFIEPYVENLTLEKIRFELEEHHDIVNFNFPKLKGLKIRNCDYQILTEPFKNVKTLVYFNITTYPTNNYKEDCNIESLKRIQAVKNILTQNHELKFLDMFMYQKDFDNFFSTPLVNEQFHFCLTSLAIDYSVQASNSIQNFNKFLVRQRCLKELYFHHWMGAKSFEIAIKTLNLTSLHIENMDSVVYNMNNEIGVYSSIFNETLENLTFSSKCKRSQDIILIALQSCSYLKTIRLHTINQDILDEIILYNEYLEYITCDYFLASDPPRKEVLTKLKGIQINICYSEVFRDLIVSGRISTRFGKEFITAAEKLDKYSLKSTYSRHFSPIYIN